MERKVNSLGRLQAPLKLVAVLLVVSGALIAFGGKFRTDSGVDGIATDELVGGDSGLDRDQRIPGQDGRNSDTNAPAPSSYSSYRELLQSLYASRSFAELEAFGVKLKPFDPDYFAIRRGSLDFCTLAAGMTRGSGLAEAPDVPGVDSTAKCTA